MKIESLNGLIRPNDSFKIKWDLLVMLLAIFNCLFVPVNISFELEELHSVGFTIGNLVIDFLFLVDILICFRTIYIDS